MNKRKNTYLAYYQYGHTESLNAYSPETARKRAEKLKRYFGNLKKIILAP